MNFIEAMRKLKNDECKIRRNFWSDGDFIYLRDGIVLEEDGSLYDFGLGDYFADDWEEYTTVNDKNTFEEALVAYKSGKNIKRKGDNMIYRYETYCEFDRYDVLANDWVILED